MSLVHNVRSEDQPDPKTLASLHAFRPAGYIILRGCRRYRRRTCEGDRQ